MTDRMRPPARRTSGRTLGGANRATPPPPPPAAELTPEQFAAEQAAAQPEGGPAANLPQHLSPSHAPVDSAAEGSAETTIGLTQSAAQAEPRRPEQEPAASRPAHPAVVTPQPADVPAELRTSQRVSADEPAASTQPAEPAAQHGPPHVAWAPSAAPSSREVAVRTTVPPMAGGTAFPVKSDGPGSHQEQDAGPYEEPGEGRPYTHGPGRPKDIPEAAVVLNQRIIARESLDSSVPAALKLKKRIKRFALDNELDHLPIGDIVSVALDEWLTARGF